MNIEQDFSELEKNLARFQMEQNGQDGNEEDEDDYPDRRFSFAPDMSKPVAQDDMEAMKAKLKEEMMK